MALEQCSQHACSQQVGHRPCYSMSVLLLLQHVIFAVCSLGQSQYAYHQTINSSSLESNLQTSDTNAIARVMCGVSNTFEMYTFAKMVLHHWSNVLCCNVLHHGFLTQGFVTCGVQYKYTGDGVLPLPSSLRHGSGACIA